MTALTHLFELGKLQCFVIGDASHAHSAEELIANPDRAQLEPVALDLGFSLDEIPVDYNCLLINSGHRQVLVDAGIGGRYGNLHRGLDSLGFAPGDIDAIVITHSDRDHVGGILEEHDRLAFPNAHYFMLASAWEYWASAESRAQLATMNNWPEEKTEFVWDIYARIRDLLTLVAPEKEFLPGFRLLPAAGHRVDHTVLKISSLGDQLLHLSDAVAHPLLMAHHDWVSTYDADPAQAVLTKKRLLDWCAAQRALVFGTHFPFPGLGYVRQTDEGWDWRPEDRTERPDPA